MKDDKGTGKTTRIFEKAIELLATLPEGHKVFITGRHSKWVQELRRRVREEGLVDVEVIFYPKVLQGHLRGHRGLLLIDDLRDFTDQEQFILLEEQRNLGLYYGR